MFMDNIPSVPFTFTFPKSNSLQQPTKTRVANTFVASDSEEESTHKNIENGDDFISFGPEDPDDNPSHPFNHNKRDYKKRDKFIDILTPLDAPAWVPSNAKYSEDIGRMFNQEIKDFTNWMKPTDAEITFRLLTVERLKEVVHKIWPSAKVEIFGSFETQLYLPSSDIDIVIIDDACQFPLCFDLLGSKLKKCLAVRDMEVIKKSRVPIIKYVDPYTKFPVDLSFNLVGGIESAVIIKKFVEDKTVGEAVRPIMLILKLFLLQRQANEVFTGGLGSYSLIILLISFLKSHPRIQSGQIDVKDNLGVLLIEFFELYGKHLNYDKVGVGIDLEYGGYFFDKTKDKNFNDPRNHTMKIAIQDPQDPTNDVSRGSYNVRKIRTDFQRAFHRLSFTMGTFVSRQQSNKNLKPLNTLLGTIIAVDRKILVHREYIEEKYIELNGSDSDSDMSLSEGDLEDRVKKVFEKGVTIQTNGDDNVVGQKRKRDIVEENERYDSLDKKFEIADEYVAGSSSGETEDGEEKDEKEVERYYKQLYNM